MPGGQPAATVGSLTAHGGTVAVGAPNVLIAGQPAARQGDMHICPMCSPSPHVGGPILNGVPNVLIAGMPAAIASSMAVCAAPAPDVILQGAPSVMIAQGGASVVRIGMGGSSVVNIGSGGGTVTIGGQGAAGGGGGAGTSAAASEQAAATGSIEATEEAEPAARVRYVDKGGAPVSGPRYTHTGGGAESESALRIHGEVRRTTDGSQETVPYGVAGAQWSKQEARVGEEVAVEAKAFGFEDGTPAKVLIYRREQGSDVLVDEIESEVSGEKVEVKWTYEYDEAAYAERKAATPDGRPRTHMPQYVAKVHVHPETAQTETLGFQDVIRFTLEDESGARCPDTSYRVHLADGTIRTGTTDGSAKAEETDIPPGRYRIGFGLGR